MISNREVKSPKVENMFEENLYIPKRNKSNNI